MRHFPIGKDSKRLLFLIGPTGVGKSEIAYSLSLKIPAEIVSCDSMQVYRGLDIGTAKPPKIWRSQVPHHMIDICEPEENFTVSDYCRLAIDEIDAIIRHGKLPIVVGGSGLYFRSLIRGIFPAKGANPAFRKKMEKEALEKGSGFLHNRLREIDPDSAEKIHPNNLKRIIRALEVYYQEGKPTSILQKEKKGQHITFESKIIGLNRDRKSLYQRLNERAEKMFQMGLVNEVEKLYKEKRLGQTAQQALGYKEVLGYLQGKYDLTEAKRLLCRNTRRFAKRQMTWFKKEPGIDWVELKENDLADKVAEHIIDIIRDSAH